MRISQTSVDRIREAMDILEVVNDFVSLKKKGSNWMACCPFHHEKTPSFSVAPAKGIFKCFGCGKGGDAISFVMEMENCSYTEALRYLAKKYSITIEEEVHLNDEKQAEQNEMDSLLIVLGFAKEFFKENLLNSSEGQTIGLSYFKERGFNQKSLDTFELGYSPSEWDALYRKATEKGYQPEILEKAGLCLKSEKGKWFDRFRERVIFPIHNLSGKVIAFGGRILKQDKKLAKYINSPETQVYSKSKVLYGIFQAKKSIREQDECILVEGYTDVISLHQAGIENAVASSGTSLTLEQIRLIRRFTNNVKIIYDGDTAGIKASVRGIDLILEEGMNVQAVLLPEGEDPDSIVKSKGGSALRELLRNQARDFITFKTELYLKEARNNPLKRAETIREVVSSIVKMPDEIKRRVFYKECSRLLEIDENVLITEGNALLKKHKPHSQDEKDNENLTVISQAENQIEEKSEKFTPGYAQEKETIRLLLKYGKEQWEGGKKVAEFILEEISDLEFEHQAWRELLEVFRKESKKGKIPDEKFFLRSDKALYKEIAIDLIHQKFSLSKNWEEKHSIFIPEEHKLLEKIVIENILRLKMNQIQKMLLENNQKMSQAQDQNEQVVLMQKALKLERVRKEIAGRLNNVLMKGI